VIDPASATSYSPGVGQAFRRREAARAARRQPATRTTPTTKRRSSCPAGKARRLQPRAGWQLRQQAIKLASGASKTGCVTFQVPNGQKVTKILYGNTVFPGNTAQWRVS
jgi:hypothetical protein